MAVENANIDLSRQDLISLLKTKNTNLSECLGVIYIYAYGEGDSETPSIYITNTSYDISQEGIRLGLALKMSQTDFHADTLNNANVKVSINQLKKSNLFTSDELKQILAENNGDPNVISNDHLIALLDEKYGSDAVNVDVEVKCQLSYNAESLFEECDEDGSLIYNHLPEDIKIVSCKVNGSNELFDKLGIAKDVNQAFEAEIESHAKSMMLENGELEVSIHWSIES